MNITLEPNPSTWAKLAQHHFNGLDDASREARAAAGLPTDRPIIASGHQPALWHPGIVAKVFAMDELCKQIDASPLWVVVDTDDVHPDTMDTPVRTDGSQIKLEQRSLSASCEKPCVDPRDRPFVPDELLGEDIKATLANASRSRSAAEQVTRAAFGLLGATAEFITVSSLAQTKAWQSIMDVVRQDAEPLALAYNAAIRAHPEAGLTMLDEHPLLGWEIPLWHLDTEGRRRAYEYEIP
ncbi:MAG: hypothetical protein AAGB34_08410, partial [Planctomycetota bacterium]